MTQRSTFLRRAALGAGVLALAACGDDGTGPTLQPAAIAVVAAAPTGSVAGMPLATAPTFVVKDANGANVAGVSVAIAVIAGNGTLTNAPTTSSASAAVVGNWTLGQTVGVNRLQITVAGVKPETISVQSIAGAPTSIGVVGNTNAQSAPGGRTTSAPVRFQLRDQFGNGVGGRQLSLAVAGGGSLAGVGAGNTAVLTTAADGTAEAPAWTLGRSVRPQSLVASLVGSAGIAATASASVLTSFDIDVRFVGSEPSAAVQAAFTDAAARLRAAITGDLPDQPIPSPINLANNCGDPALPTAFSETVDDVVIFAQSKPIDGPGKILGQAGACYARTTAQGAIRQPFIGVMTFDSADLAAMVANGTITDVMMHEMMHVLGFSAGFFQAYGILSGRDTPDVAFLGANGTRGCRELGATTTCASSVPLENTGGAGTANSHWRETTFDVELMTGFINGPARPLSGMTIGAFEDMGYGVNYDAKDIYVTSSPLLAGARASLSVGPPGEAWEEVIVPRMTLSPDGRVQRRRLEVP